MPNPPKGSRAAWGVAAERDLFECRSSTLVHCVQQRAISRRVDLADCVMRQALRVISDEVRIYLFVAVGDLGWDRNLGFHLRSVYAILVGIQSSFYSTLLRLSGGF